MCHYRISFRYKTAILGLRSCNENMLLGKTHNSDVRMLFQIQKSETKRFASFVVAISFKRFLSTLFLKRFFQSTLDQHFRPIKRLTFSTPQLLLHVFEHLKNDVNFSSLLHVLHSLNENDEKLHHIYLALLFDIDYSLLAYHPPSTTTMDVEMTCHFYFHGPRSPDSGGKHEG